MVTFDAWSVLPPPTAYSTSESVWWQTPVPFLEYGQEGPYVSIAYRRCYFVPTGWACTITLCMCPLCFGWEGDVPNRLALVHLLSWEAKEVLE